VKRSAPHLAMADFTIRGDHVNVEQIMRQIRMRIKEKRGVDYTEDEIRELANVKLEKFLDPRAVRSDLVAEYRRQRASVPPDNFQFEDTTVYESHRAPVLMKIRKLLNPVLKLFFNPNPIIQALHKQSKLNSHVIGFEELNYEVVHNLVLELTRLGIEVKNLRMQVEAMSARQEFNERRARALEGLVQSGMDEDTAPETAADAGGGTEAAEGGDSRPRRRRRRRGRRRTDGGQAPRDAGGDGGPLPEDEGGDPPSPESDTDR
jgi:hypothetical protein